MSDHANPPSGDHPSLNSASKSSWDANAAFWDGVQGDEGNHWQRTLIFPATERLLALRPGARLLELACGNGNFARAMAARGMEVVATDQSAPLLELARGRASTGAPITYAQVDVTDEAALRGIEGGPFDAAVANMAIMDIAEIRPMFRALPALLRPDAPFVFSLLHPAYNQGPDTELFMERRETADGRLEHIRGIKVRTYKTPVSLEGIAVVGQPVLQRYFHRPLEVLLGAAFDEGWALDGLEEPAFSSAHETESPLTWDHMPEIPPVMVARLRVARH